MIIYRMEYHPRWSQESKGIFCGSSFQSDLKYFVRQSGERYHFYKRTAEVRTRTK